MNCIRPLQQYNRNFSRKSIKYTKFIKEALYVQEAGIFQYCRPIRDLILV